MTVIDQQSQSTFDPTGRFHRNEYTFSRKTTQGTETLPLSGVGNPLANGTGLVRSAFRYVSLLLQISQQLLTYASPSDDATILGFFIPANAMMAVELKRTAAILRQAGKSVIAQSLERRGQAIADGIWEYGVMKHKTYGDVFAFEVDGYGSSIIMDDANIPSLLALPMLSFVSPSDPVYQNTRRMILEKNGNPYYLRGSAFHGIGGQ